MQKPETKIEPTESTDFFETMPLTANHFVYRDDASDLEALADPNLENEIRTTAIITLVLVAITALALGLLVWNGLGTIKGAMNPSINTTAYEL